MADSIKITTQVLIDTAASIREINGQLRDKLAQINKQMDGLEASWKSEGATEIRANMNALKPRFEEYQQIVNSYAAFLDKTAQSYEATETAVTNNATAFRQ